MDDNEGELWILSLNRLWWLLHHYSSQWPNCWRSAFGYPSPRGTILTTSNIEVRADADFRDRIGVWDICSLYMQSSGEMAECIQKLCRFMATNFSSYGVIHDHNERDEQESFRRRMLEKLLRVKMFSTQKQNVFTPETITPDRSLGLRGRCIAFRKNNEDSRRWDHHARF